MLFYFPTKGAAHLERLGIEALAARRGLRQYTQSCNHNILVLGLRDTIPCTMLFSERLALKIPLERPYLRPQVLVRLKSTAVDSESSRQGRANQSQIN